MAGTGAQGETCFPPKEPLALLSRLYTSFAADEFTVKGLKTSTKMSTYRQKPPQKLECPF